MASASENQFEIERRSILFKSSTSMPDETLLGYNGDPNNVVEGNSDGEFLIYNSPIGTSYIEDDGTMWDKAEMPNVWTVRGGSISGQGIAGEGEPKFQIDELDTTSGYFTDKIFPGSNVTFSEEVSGGEKRLFINAELNANGIYGSVEIPQNDETIRISYGQTISGSGTPLVSLVMPLSGAFLQVTGIYNSDSTGFNVMLSSPVRQPGYKVNWTLNTSQQFNLSALGQSIIPSQDITYDLGTSDKRWRDLYLSGSTIYIGDQTISVTESTSGGDDLSQLAFGGQEIVVLDDNGSLPLSSIPSEISSGLSFQDTLDPNAAQLPNISGYGIGSYFIAIDTGTLTDGISASFGVSEGDWAINNGTTWKKMPFKLPVRGITSSQIKIGGVQTDNIFSGAVTNAKIANDSVTLSKMASNVFDINNFFTSEEDVNKVLRPDGFGGFVFAHVNLDVDDLDARVDVLENFSLDPRLSIVESDKLDTSVFASLSGTTDLTNYYTKTEVDGIISGQGSSSIVTASLSAGSGILITNNVISADVDGINIITGVDNFDVSGFVEYDSGCVGVSDNGQDITMPTVFQGIQVRNPIGGTLGPFYDINRRSEIEFTVRYTNTGIGNRIYAVFTTTDVYTAGNICTNFWSYYNLGAVFGSDLNGFVVYGTGPGSAKYLTAPIVDGDVVKFVLEKGVLYCYHNGVLGLLATSLANENVHLVIEPASGGGVTLENATYRTNADTSIALADTTVIAGSYTNSSITVDSKGRLTSASSGTTPLLPSNNLSDVGNTETSLNNLGGISQTQLNSISGNLQGQINTKLDTSTFAALSGSTDLSNYYTKSEVDGAISGNASTVIEYSTSIDATYTDTKSIRIYVDTSSAPVSITIPSGSVRQKVEIIDAGENAGTNIITVVGMIDGVANTTIEANGGSREFSYSGSAWESSGGFNQFFERNAAAGRITAKQPDQFAADQLVGGDLGSVFTGGVSDFSNAGANVDQDAGGWGNLNVSGAEDETDALVLGDFSFPETNGSINAYDNNTGTFDAVDAGSSTAFNPTTHIVDFGAGNEKAIDEWTTRSSSGNSIHLDGDLSYSSDGVSWTVINTFTSHSGPNSSRLHTFTNSIGSRRYWRTRFFSFAGVNISEVKLTEHAPATTLNTFEHVVLQAGSSTSFDTSTLALVDSEDTPLSNGDVTIRWSGDNGATWSASYGLDAFKALGIITDTDFRIEYTLVGESNLKTSTIQTASTYASMSSTGLEVVVDAEVVAEITADGVAVPSGTFGDTGSAYKATIEDFEQAESNVDQDEEGWGNGYVNGTANFNEGNENTDNSTPYAVTAEGLIDGEQPWYLFSDIGETYYKGNPKSFSIDLAGTPKRFAKVRFKRNSGGTTGANPQNFTIYGSDDDFVTQDTLAQHTSLSPVAQGQWTELYDIQVTKAYRYYKCVMTGTFCYITRVDFREQAPATTVNTFQYRPVTAGDLANYAPSTLTALGATDTPLLDSELLVEYSTDGSLWSSQYGLDAFRALPLIVGATTLWLRYELVGSATLKSSSINTASSYMVIGTGGVDVVVEGTTVANIGTNITTTGNISGAAIYGDELGVGDVTFTDEISGGSPTLSSDFLKIITPSGTRWLPLYQ